MVRSTATASYSCISVLTLTSVASSASQIALAYSQTNVASDGVGPYAYAVTAGALPDGLALNAATGLVSGTPTAAGAFSYTVTTTRQPEPAGDGGADHQGTITPAAPAVSWISPNFGAAAGGAVVTIGGVDFTGATGVSFGGAAAASFTVDDDNSITATAPAGSGAVDVTVTTPGGTSDTSVADVFNYVAGTGGVVGFAEQRSGGRWQGRDHRRDEFQRRDCRQIRGRQCDLVQRSRRDIYSGQSAGGQRHRQYNGDNGRRNERDQFERPIHQHTRSHHHRDQPEPGVGGQGGTLVSIVGTNLTGATGVKFGSVAATSFSASSATTATATAPPARRRAVNVTITTPGGTSAAAAGNLFTYTPAPVMKVIAKFAGGANDGGKPFGVLVADKQRRALRHHLGGRQRQQGHHLQARRRAPIRTRCGPRPSCTSSTGRPARHLMPALVIDNAGNLYGTTTAGGTNNKGVVFKYTASTKKVTVLYSFKGNATDGGVPYAGLARDTAGVLYGFTSEGGKAGFGTAFEIAANNQFTVTHHFTGGDRRQPARRAGARQATAMSMAQLWTAARPRTASSSRSRRTMRAPRSTRSRRR